MEISHPDGIPKVPTEEGEKKEKKKRKQTSSWKLLNRSRGLEASMLVLREILFIKRDSCASHPPRAGRGPPSAQRRNGRLARENVSVCVNRRTPGVKAFLRACFYVKHMCQWQEFGPSPAPGFYT